MSKWNIALLSKDEQDKVSVDKAAAAVAWQERRVCGAGGAATFVSGRRSLPGFCARADRRPPARTPAIMLT
ncbi:DNA polymerase III subunit theta, partial [Klebsiella pneumoniae]|uniref:DNA polymerase III subunit theta n=1 Tax=Klebsiella pneumoniae TaxID=573 RepID=UPI002351DEF7